MIAVIKAEYIDRNALLNYLEAADIPVTRTERELIKAMPTLTDVGDRYKEKTANVSELIRGIWHKNKYGSDARTALFRRKRNADNR